MHLPFIFQQTAGTDKNSSVPASINLLSKITISISHPEQVLTSHIHLQTLISASKADFPAYTLPHNLTHWFSHKEKVYLSGQNLPEEFFCIFACSCYFPRKIHYIIIKLFSILIVPPCSSLTPVSKSP